MDSETILVGVALVSGLLVWVYRRISIPNGHSGYDYKVPRLGVWGAGRGSPSESLQDAEMGIDRRTEIE